MAFFGRYIEVTPHSRLVWTNEESDDGAVTTAPPNNSYRYKSRQKLYEKRKSCYTILNRGV